MDRLIYTAYSGLTGSMVTQQVIASNMANAQTIGFRAEMLNADPMTLKGPSIEARAMTRGEVRGANMKQGALIETGNPLDVALTGRTMLAVQGADGEEAYTRRGDLSVDATGLLTNGDGRPVVWVIARQHPGESMAEWWMEGFLGRLLDPSDPLGW